MKKIKLSLIVAIAILGASVSAFTEKGMNPADGWYPQHGAGGPDFSQMVSLSDVNANCPSGTSKICAVLVSGGVITTQRKSTQYFPN